MNLIVIADGFIGCIALIIGGWLVGGIGGAMCACGFIFLLSATVGWLLNGIKNPQAIKKIEEFP